MASFSNSFSSGSFSVDVAVPALVGVAFGGGAETRRKRRYRDAVRDDLIEAYRVLSAEAEPEQRVEARQIVTPYAATVVREKPRRIDWSAFEADLAAVERLLALYEEHLEREADDETVVALLLA